MMRGKSPRSDVEISKKLNFVAAILDFWKPSSIDDEHKKGRNYCILCITFIQAFGQKAFFRG